MKFIGCLAHSRSHGIPDAEMLSLVAKDSLVRYVLCCYSCLRKVPLTEETRMTEDEHHIYCEPCIAAIEARN